MDKLYSQSDQMFNYNWIDDLLLDILLEHGIDVDEEADDD